MDANAATFLPLPNLLAIDFDESEVSPEMIPIETFADLFHGGSGSFHTMNSTGLLFRVTSAKNGLRERVISSTM